jgi:SAM-dependent methyltransferase
MLKELAKIIRFAITDFNSFFLLNSWARRELRRAKLTRLADMSGSDKGFKRHMYTRIYDDLFSEKRETIQSVLEIGLLCHEEQGKIGGEAFSVVPSLDMWAAYFPAAKVYGFDLRDFRGARGNWTRILRGDQSSREDLNQIAELNETFDVIIDDALHASYHQQITFSHLFRLVKPGGYFIIEDLHYQPTWAEEENPIEKTINLLEILRYEGRWKSPVADLEERDHIESNVYSVDIYDSMSFGIGGAKALAVIRKK